ncbi:hypothetical protein [Streptomyces sp. cg35]|uniref:hypothetical protein n=1 Tax=Streptomyces sp. cg35 TaxID=3421650 RepID=UPI003D164234
MSEQRVTVRVEKRFAGGPEIGSVVTVTRTPFLDNLIRSGILTVVHLPHEPGED